MCILSHGACAELGPHGFMEYVLDEQTGARGEKEEEEECGAVAGRGQDKGEGSAARTALSTWTAGQLEAAGIS